MSHCQPLKSAMQTIDVCHVRCTVKKSQKLRSLFKRRAVTCTIVRKLHANHRCSSTKRVQKVTVADNFLSVQPKSLEVGPSDSETLFESFGPSSEHFRCAVTKLSITCKPDMHVTLSFVRVDRGAAHQKSLVKQREKSSNDAL